MGHLKEAVRAVTPKQAIEVGRKTIDGISATLGAQKWFHSIRLKLKPRQAIFSDIYDSQSWGSSESGSGTGSELRATQNIRDGLPQLLSRYGIKSLLDAPCGDWNWMQHVTLPLDRYYGFDIVPSVIERNRVRYSNAKRQFAVADLTQDELPKVDAILCRDCLVHVSYADISAILRNFKRTGATYLFLNSYPQAQANVDQLTGVNYRLLDFRRPPFNFPEPIEAFPDGGIVDPNIMCLWKLQELPDLAP